MSGTQGNIFSTSTKCYNESAKVQLEIEQIIDEFNPSVIANRFQIINIKVQASLAACNIEILVNQLDSRMSNLDFTTGLVSNVVSQIFSGLNTQNFEMRSNSNEAQVWLSFNRCYVQL